MVTPSPFSLYFYPIGKLVKHIAWFLEIWCFHYSYLNIICVTNRSKRKIKYLYHSLVTVVF